MGAGVAEVLAGTERWCCECAPWEQWLPALPDDSVDLLFTSPPYRKARTYGIDAGRDTEEWTAWMVAFVRAAAPKVNGLIAINCEGQTEGYAYQPTPFLLAADLFRAGFNLRKPPVFHRVGIPGSGGPDWLRNDYEPIVCVTRPGRLPWSDNTACGHPPKWAPGGVCSNRLTDGTRVNQWGHSLGSGATVVEDGGVVRSKGKRPSHVETTRKKKMRGTYREGGRAISIGVGGGEQEAQQYVPPAIANPGNVLSINTGGGLMGHALSHENEAPFPLDLAAFFVKSFCPPGGVACDPFSGSGTTCDAAVQNGRRFVGCDVRQSQVELCARRMRTVTPALFCEDT